MKIEDMEKIRQCWLSNQILPSEMMILLKEDVQLKTYFLDCIKLKEEKENEYHNKRSST